MTASACIAQDIERWEEEAAELVACVSAANQALVEVVPLALRSCCSPCVFRRQPERGMAGDLQLKHRVSALTRPRVQAREENALVSKDKADLLVQVSRLAQEKDSMMKEKAHVEQELARRREQEQEEDAAAATHANEETGEGDEVKALRRRLTYWRQRDKTREEERQRELQELAEREGERYKQRQKDAQALKQAEAHAQRLESRLASLEVAFLALCPCSPLRPACLCAP